ncbi:MAG: radical SAM protein [Phycisphaerae bacterium]|nr:radical SAM protein [Phycisphaerae bacterium]
MINLSKLYGLTDAPGDALRYGTAQCAQGPRRPVVVWNATRRCNLRCAHCYADSDDAPADGELTTDEAVTLIDDLAGFGAAVLLISGGEPLLRSDLVELVAHARHAGLRTALSTNATLASTDLAQRLGEAGLSYAGVSFDGTPATHDAFRGARGAYDAATAGLRHFRQANVRVGLRFTLTRDNAADAPAMFDLARREGVDRLCFYHLVATGRGAALDARSLSHSGTRRVLDALIDAAVSAHRTDRPAEVLTVDNHADGPYAYLRLRREDPDAAERSLALLRRQGGNASGERIACIGWRGDVHPDPFWRTRAVGNVRRRPFSAIWSDARQPLLAALRARPAGLTGRCSRCRWLDVCNGNLRARAEAAGDPWGDDPACYLTDAEIDPNRDV